MRRSSIFSNSKHICRVKFCQVHHVLKIHQKLVQLWHFCSFPENSNSDLACLLGLVFFSKAFHRDWQKGGASGRCFGRSWRSTNASCGELAACPVKRGSSRTVPEVVTSYHWLITISYKWDPPKRGLTSDLVT